MANECLIYEDKWENVIWKDEYEFLFNEKHKQIQIVNSLENDIYNDLEFTRIIEMMFNDFRIDLNDMFHSKLLELCTKFKEFNSINPYDKSIFVGIRRTLINKERKRLKFLEIELEKFKQICSSEPTLYELEKEEHILIRSKFCKNNFKKFYLFKLFSRMNLLNEWKEFLIRDFYDALNRGDNKIRARIEFIAKKIVQLNCDRFNLTQENLVAKILNEFTIKLKNQIENGSDYQSENGSDYQSENELDYQSANELDYQSESDSDYQIESDSDYQIESESGGELVNKSDYQNESDGQLEYKSDIELVNRCDGDLVDKSNYQNDQLEDKNDIIQSNNLSPNTIKRLIGMDLIDLIDEDDDNNEYEFDCNLTKLIKKSNTTKDSSDIDLDEFDQIDLKEIEEIENILKNTKSE